MDFNNLSTTEKQRVYKQAIQWKHQYMDRQNRELMMLVADFYGVTIDDVRGKSRKRYVAECRHSISYLFRKYTRMSLQEIGGLMNNDHASVLHGMRKIKTYMETNQLLRGWADMEERFKNVIDEENT